MEEQCAMERNPLVQRTLENCSYFCNNLLLERPVQWNSIDPVRLRKQQKYNNDAVKGQVYAHHPSRQWHPMAKIVTIKTPPSKHERFFKTTCLFVRIVVNTISEGKRDIHNAQWKTRPKAADLLVYPSDYIWSDSKRNSKKLEEALWLDPIGKEWNRIVRHRSRNIWL